MKQYKLFNIILAFMIFSCNSKKPKEKALISKTQFKTTLNEYNPISICDCNDDGVKTLRKILDIRGSFQTFELYEKDKLSVNSIKSLKKNWTLIRDNCLKKFATTLLIPSNCNQPKKIEDLRKKLDKLKIRTS